LKGLLLAGGHGTRLRPLTYTGNKHMLPIANKPMLQYGLEHLQSAGIKEIAIILGPISEGVVEAFGDGSRFGVHLTYIQQPDPKGLAHAVQISKSYMKDEPFVMYLGDNLLKQGASDFITTFNNNSLDCLVGVCPVPDPSRFGIAEMNGDRIVRLVEKPKEPKSNLALIGVYIFGPAIFDAVDQIKPSWRNELEITDAIQTLLVQGKKVQAQRVTGWWKDTGKPEDLLEANQLVLSGLNSSIQGAISNDTKITGNVELDLGSKTVGVVNIRGPAIIGTNCTIGPNVYIGPYTTIGDDCVIKNVQIENSIVMKGSTIESDQRIVDSLIGSYSTILSASGSLPRGYKLVIGERSFAQI
jgi:glucose-1-phosphate thymidylyltransferase